MQANNKRKVFGDAVDLLMDDIEERAVPKGLQMLSVKSIKAFHDHPFHLYEGERLENMIASIKEHNKLWKLLIDKNMNKTDLRDKSQISTASLSVCMTDEPKQVQKLTSGSAPKICHCYK